MVRVWLRPALSALSRQALQNGKPVALKAGSQQLLSAQQVLAIRAFSSSKKDKTKALSEKFAAAEEDSIEIPPEVEYLSKESLKDTWKDELDPELLKALQEGDLVLDQSDGDDEDDDVDEIDQLEELLSRDTDEDEFLDDDEDSELTDAEWAAKYERELASIDVDGSREVEDDRLFVEMPVRDRSMMLAADGAVDVEDSDSDDDDDDDDDDNVSESSDPFVAWDQGMAYTPEMMNWMRENKTKTQPFNTRNEKPWKYFVRANHPDVVELAMDVDLLRLFISPTGRIRPRRFTGLTAKQQRRLAQAIKISRQMALLPYLSRYPEPSPEQWRAMEEDEIARLMAAAENEDENDDDDDDELEELEEE